MSSSSSSSDSECWLFPVNVTHVEFIKPSSPTPPHLRSFKLSLLDLFFPAEYSSVVFFYPNNNNNNNHHHENYSAESDHQLQLTLAKLRGSLSDSLCRFYPLAGRIFKDKSAVVDCSDQGVSYVEAEANRDLAWLLSSPHPKNDLVITHLSPLRKYCTVPLHEAPILAVKVSVFQCGGISVGISFNHLLVDGHTVSVFLKDWAAATSRLLMDKENKNKKNNDPPVVVNNVAASLFPVSEAVLREAELSWKGALFSKQGSCRTQRFVFGQDAVLRLKSSVVGFSRTEALFALLWRCATKAASQTTPSSSSVAFSMVNLRRRFETPLSDYSIGNLVWTAVARYEEKPGTADEDDHCIEVARMANLLRCSSREVDRELLEKVTGAEGHIEIMKWQGKVNEMCSSSSSNSNESNIRQYDFSSLVNFGANDIDFGWGKPLWASLLAYTEGTMRNTMGLISATTNDDSVDAWVSLDEQDMAIFERDPQLLKYATVNPTIIFPDS